MRYAALRYFNAAGADPDGTISERREPETHVIPLAIRGALKSDYGSEAADASVGDLSAKRAAHGSAKRC